MTDDTLNRLREALAGRYAVHREIDRGAMAVVYLADDLKHHRPVAIKVVLPALATTVGTDRFLREIEVIASLQHPHILTLIDSGEVEGLPYYVMPFVEGQSLKERLGSEGALPVEEAVRIACEVADGLAAAHEKGVIHRDVKPGNVLLSGGHAVVADFGIAAAVDQASLGRLTATGVSLGSPAYMSPEQASGDRVVDMRTDVYALGCVLYEMLTGTPPFEGSVRSLVTQKILGRFRPIQELRSDIPGPLAEAVSRALATEPDERFPSVSSFRETLLAALPRPEAEGPARRRMWIATAAVAVVTLGAIATVQRVREGSERTLWAAQRVAEVEDLVEKGRLSDALAVAEEVESVFPGDSALTTLLPRFSFTVPIRTDPPGARVSLQRVDGPEDEWEYLGETPLEGVRFAGLTFQLGDTDPDHAPDRPYRLRFELDGHVERELHLTAILGANWRGAAPMDPVVLDAESPELEGMVRVPGFTREGVRYQDFYMDRHEVTNRAFKVFVDAGGYEKPEYWAHPFVRDGVELSFDEAMALFRDQTGRPGPSTWRFGTYLEGQRDYPVGGVSWYEAAAYARWAGKELPSTLQWNRGRPFFREDSYVILPRSNLGSDGPRPVGQNGAMTTLGVYDLVGNVREWCYNEAGGGSRATRGAAWTDAPFHVGWVIPKPGFDRDATNGFRLIRAYDDEEALAALRYPVTGTVERDYWSEEPASDVEFAVFRRLYDYDAVPLNPRVERADTFEHWVREHVTFDLPYGERGGVALYVPKNAQAPFQAVVYWGGSGLMRMRSIDEEWVPAFDYMVRSGRAVVVPIFAGAYGRPDPRPSERHGTSGPAGPNDHGYREIFIRWVKDLRTSIDYLETRADLDTERVGYFGFSFGGRTAPVALAVEPRITAAVLNVGGLNRSSFLPEVDAFNFVPRVRTPVLMINGEHDIVFPYESSQRPMFERLGTPPEHKRHYVSPAAHIVPLDEVITETLGWFDRYLGVPGGG